MIIEVWNTSANFIILVPGALLSFQISVAVKEILILILKLFTYISSYVRLKKILLGCVSCVVAMYIISILLTFRTLQVGGLYVINERILKLVGDKYY